MDALERFSRMVAVYCSAYSFGVALGIATVGLLFPELEQEYYNLKFLGRKHFEMQVNEMIHDLDREGVKCN